MTFGSNSNGATVEKDAFENEDNVKFYNFQEKQLLTLQFVTS